MSTWSLFRRRLSWGLPLLVAATVVGSAAGVDRLGLLCLAQQEDGKWRNADPNTRSLTRIELDFTCQDQILNGEPYPPGPPWHTHVWGKCHPSDCDWGNVGGERLSNDKIYSRYNQGYARRYVYSKMSQYRPGQLWVYTWTDFSSNSRQDYGSHNWFVRE
jgi:hypothetical protein